MSQKDGKEQVQTWERQCPQCKTYFQTKRSKKKFCTDRCRVDNWQQRFPRVDPTTGEPRRKTA